MSVSRFLAEVEEDQKWREEELRFLHNQLADLPTTKDRDWFRRTLIVMLYSHFEGFCRTVFLSYIRTVNDLGLKCGQANYALAAASLADVFAALRDPQRRSREFRNQLPDDTKLHLFAREREFVERADTIEQRPVSIPDSVIDLGGNLKPVTLRKALFRLGLPYDQFLQFEGQINKLLEYRNKIAHGSFREGINEETYESIRTVVYQMMNSVKHNVSLALQEQRYLRTG